MSKECMLNHHEIRSEKDLDDFIEKYQTPWGRPLGRIGKAILYEQMKGCFVKHESSGQPSKKLQEHWKTEEEKRKRFEKNPLSVT